LQSQGVQGKSKWLTATLKKRRKKLELQHQPLKGWRKPNELWHR